jgi:hypothetical protein
MLRMKHVKVLSRPRRAAQVGTGTILTIISQLFAVIAEFFTEKDASEEEF